MAMNLILRPNNPLHIFDAIDKCPRPTAQPVLSACVARPERPILSQECEKRCALMAFAQNHCSKVALHVFDCCPVQ